MTCAVSMKAAVSILFPPLLHLSMNGVNNGNTTTNDKNNPTNTGSSNYGNGSTPSPDSLGGILGESLNNFMKDCCNGTSSLVINR